MKRTMKAFVILCLLATGAIAAAILLPASPISIPPTTANRAVYIRWNKDSALQNLTPEQKADFLSLDPGIDFQMLVNSIANTPSVVNANASAYFSQEQCIGWTATPVTVQDKDQFSSNNDWQSLCMAGNPGFDVTGENGILYHVTWTGDDQHNDLTNNISAPQMTVLFTVTVVTEE